MARPDPYRAFRFVDRVRRHRGGRLPVGRRARARDQGRALPRRRGQRLRAPARRQDDLSGAGAEARSRRPRAVGLAPGRHRRARSSGETISVILLDDARRRGLAVDLRRRLPGQMDRRRARRAVRAVATEAIEFVHRGITAAGMMIGRLPVQPLPMGRHSGRQPHAEVRHRRAGSVTGRSPWCSADPRARGPRRRGLPPSRPSRLSVHFAVLLHWAERLRLVVQQAAAPAPLPPIALRLLTRGPIEPAERMTAPRPDPPGDPPRLATPRPDGGRAGRRWGSRRDGPNGGPAGPHPRTRAAPGCDRPRRRTRAGSAALDRPDAGALREAGAGGAADRRLGRVMAGAGKRHGPTGTDARGAPRRTAARPGLRRAWPPRPRHRRSAVSSPPPAPVPEPARRPDTARRRPGRPRLAADIAGTAVGRRAARPGSDQRGPARSRG